MKKLLFAVLMFVAMAVQAAPYALVGGGIALDKPTGTVGAGLQLNDWLNAEAGYQKFATSDSSYDNYTCTSFKLLAGGQKMCATAVLTSITRVHTSLDGFGLSLVASPQFMPDAPFHPLLRAGLFQSNHGLLPMIGLGIQVGNFRFEATDFGQSYPTAEGKNNIESYMVTYQLPL